MLKIHQSDCVAPKHANDNCCEIDMYKSKCLDDCLSSDTTQIKTCVCVRVLSPAIALFTQNTWKDFFVYVFVQLTFLGGQNSNITSFSSVNSSIKRAQMYAVICKQYTYDFESTRKLAHNG